MPSPDTSAQGAPVASQEAEAREAVVRAGWSFGGPNRGPGGRASLTAINKAIDAYAAVIRASERGRYAALVEAVIWMSGADDFAPGKPAHAHWIEIRDGVLASALAELEEAESV